MRRAASTKAEAELYLNAAESNVIAARLLLENRHYSAASYLSGLSVECVLRAYSMLIGKPFDSHHNLLDWLDKSCFRDRVGENEILRINTSFNTVIVQWHNTHRYRDNEAIGRYFKKLRLDRGIQGDYVKELARNMVDAALDIVSVGRVKWTNL